MPTKRTAIDKVKAFVEECNKRGINFNKVILFGSVVRGDAKRFSDIDVAFISDQFTGHPFKDFHLLSPINIHFTAIEPHPYTPKDFEEGDPFIDEIKRTGIEIK
jgi:predicted nucleotidyltransferase